MESPSNSSSNSSRVEVFVRSVIEVASGLTCPTSSSSSSSLPINDGDSKNGQEVIENAFGEISHVTTATNNADTTSINPAEKTRRVKKRHHRNNLLRRKQSSLKALTPEDLGSVLSPSPLLLTSSSATNDRSNSFQLPSSISSASALGGHYQPDHISAFHLNRSISNYNKQEKINGGNNEEISYSNSNINNNNNNGVSRESNYNPDNIMDKLASSLPSLSLSSSQDKGAAQQTETPSVNNSKLRVDQGQQGQLDNNIEDNHRNGSHGHLCVHHYHHHSHHHHYYGSEHFNQPEQHDQNYHSFFPKNEPEKEQKNSKGDDDGRASSCSEDEHHQYLHNEILGNNEESRYLKQVIVSPLPHDLHDISFYRKFSATSPLQSKSSLQWPTSTEDLSSLTFHSKWKRQKSRSTPIKLDAVGKVAVSPSLPTAPTRLHTFPGIRYGCICDGCPYCCNEMECACSCDECCCARQSNLKKGVPIEDVGKIGRDCSPNSGNIVSESIKPHSGCFSSERSRSMDSLFPNKGDIDPYKSIEITEETLNSPEVLIDEQLFSHLNYFESDEESNQSSRNEIGEKHSGSTTDGNIDDQIHYLMVNPDTCRGKKAGVTSIADATTNVDRHSTNIVGNLTDSRSERVQSCTTNIVITRKTPTRSPVGGFSGGNRRTNGRSNNTRNMLRVANGGIRSSPISPVTLSIGKPDDDNVDDNDMNTTVGQRTELRQSGRSATSNATMTIALDSMSLFLDAVHIQVNQD